MGAGPTGMGVAERFVKRGRGDVDSALVVEMLLGSLEVLTRPDTLQHGKSVAEMVTFAVRTVIDGCAER